jgi:hypothetical protein
MGKIFAGWKKAAVWDPSTGDVVQLNMLSTEHSDMPEENIKVETPTGSAFGGKLIPIIIGFLTDDGLGQLEAWQEARTLVNLGIYARFGRQVVARENEQIHVVRGVDVDARNGLNIHRLEYEAIGEAPDIIYKQNVAEGIQFTGNAGEIILPITGITWTVAADYTTSSGNLVVTAYDFAGSQVAISTQALSAGRVSTQLTTPANTWKIEIDLVDGGSSSPSNISMRADGNPEYSSN